MNKRKPYKKGQIFTCPVCGKQWKDWASQNPIHCSRKCAIIGTTISPIIRFWEKVDKNGPVPDPLKYPTLTDRCWLWTGKRSKLGYGRFRNCGKEFPVHKFSYILANGGLPKGLFACHACDNPPCCNPMHIFAGTCADNNADMRAKKRQAFGERHGNATLTEQDVTLIVSSRKRGISYNDILKLIEGKVSRKHVAAIANGRKWKLRGQSSLQPNMYASNVAAAP